MHANRTLIPLLLVSSLAIDVCLVASLPEGVKWPNALVAVTMGLASGQVNVATFWAMLGRGRLPGRIIALLAVPIGWAFALVTAVPSVLPEYHLAAVWGVHFLTQTVLLAPILSGIRVSGALLQPDDHPLTAPTTRPRQFTLRYLFAWLTATAISLSLLKTTFDNANLAEINVRWIDILILGATNSLLGLTTVWIAIDTRPNSKRLAALLLTGLPIACIVMITFAGIVWELNDPRRPLAVLILWTMTTLYSVAALLVLRMAQYRLVWQGARSTTASPSPP